MDKPGPREPSLTPYMIEPARLAGECASKRIVMVTAAQSGKTETFLDVMGARLDQRPAPILYVAPTKQFLTEQFEPRVMALLDQAPSLMAKVSRGKRMTKTRKTVAGVSLRLAHAGSSAALKSDPARLAFMDEFDEMLANVKGQGDPLGLVERRGDTFVDFVCVVASTPSKGMVLAENDERSHLKFWGAAGAEDVRESPVWLLWQQGTRHHWAWPCPHCYDYFIPRFECLRWPDKSTPAEAADSSWLECPHCGGVIEERHKRDMNARGRYVAPGQCVDRDGMVSGSPRRSATVSFWVSGLCSPFVTFGDRARVYLEAVETGESDKIQTAINGGFGEVYSPIRRDVHDWQEVAKRRLPHHFCELPDKVVRLTAAVDVQKAGLFYSIRGWGERATSWQIESGELPGFTNEPDVWGLLTEVLADSYAELHVQACLIDSGFRPDKGEGVWVNSVYDYCSRFKRVCRATKGYDHLAAPIMRGKGNVTIPGRGVQPVIEIVRLDTDFWKSRLHERLSWPVDQPGGFWLSSDASEDYCRQLVSEVRTVAPNGRPTWVPIARRNHFLDVEAMNEAAGHLIGAQKIPLGTTRSQMFEAVPPSNPVDPPEEAAADAPTPQPQPPQRPYVPRQPSWIDRRNDWFQR